MCVHDIYIYMSYKYIIIICNNNKNKLSILDVRHGHGKREGSWEGLEGEKGGGKGYNSILVKIHF